MQYQRHFMAHRAKGCPNRGILFYTPIICHIFSDVFWPQTSFSEMKCSGVLMGRRAFQLTSHSSINLFYISFLCCFWMLVSVPVALAEPWGGAAAGVPAEPKVQPCAVQWCQLSSCPWLCTGHSKGTAETKGLLKFKWHGSCEDIFYLFWHLHCQQEWQNIHHSPSFCRVEAHGNLKGFSWGILSKWATEFDGIIANVNEQAGQGLPRESFKDAKTASLLMAPQGALLCDIWWGSPSKNTFWNCQERTDSQKGNQVPNIHWNLWLQGSKTEFSALGGQLTAIVTT